MLDKMMRVPDEKFNNIIDAVCYWMGYQFRIGREQLIHEASLRYPVTDTITSEGIAVNRIILEKSHPVFKSKRIDLVIYSEGSKDADFDSDIKLEKVFEFKIAKIETSRQHGDEHQRVFDDLARLAYYNLWKDKECYFLMCGQYTNFKNYFANQMKVPVKSKGKIVVPESISTDWGDNELYKDWFGFSINETKEIEFSDDKEEWGLKSFKANYSIRDETKQSFQNSLKIRTTCLAITPAKLEDSKTHAAGIWKIEGIA